VFYNYKSTCTTNIANLLRLPMQSVLGHLSSRQLPNDRSQMSSSKTIVVFGSGPGIGRSVAQEFTSNGFNHVILLSRHHARLHQDKLALEKIDAHVKIDTIPVNLADKASLKDSLSKIDSLAREIECVFYNGARVAPSTLLEFPVEEMELDFKVSERLPLRHFKADIGRLLTWDFTSSRNGASQNSRLSQSHPLTQNHRYWSRIACSTNTHFPLSSP
jgi:nucleoside-diphosphate-sugar epimerase